MADELMTVQQFGAAVKAKYPDYAGMSDEDIGARMLQKYPEYGDRVTPFSRRGGMSDPAMASPEVFTSTNEKDAQGNAVVRPDEGSGVLGFVSHVGQQLNPLPAIGQAVMHPIDTVKNIGAAQGALFDKAKQSYDKGDYVTAARHFVDYLLPLVGPALDKSADEMQAGQYAAGAGDAVGIGLSMFGPKALNDLAAAKYQLAANPQPPAPAPSEAQQAVRAGQAAGVPVDVATATGNRFVRGVQKLADESMGGSVVAQKANEATGQAMGTWGDTLADTARGASVTPEQAGQGIRDALALKLQAHNDLADHTYNAIRAVEEATPGGIPVDLTTAKKALQPLYDQMKRQMPITQQQSSPGLKAIENILSSPDSGTLSQIDRDLSAIKSVARDQGGIAKVAVSKLDDAVRAAARNAGPNVARQLEQGRQATIAKVGTQELIDALPGGKLEEPLAVFKAATAPKDAGIEMLRTVKEQVPQALPQIARAKLEDLMSMGPDKAAAEWGKLGSETKSILFQQKGQAQELDRFFMLGKKLAENPNPSGSALTLWKGGELVAYGANPLGAAGYSLGMTALSKLLHTPATTQALNRLLSLSLQPAAPAAAKAAASANLLRMAQQVGVPIEAAAGTSQSEPR